MDPIRERRLRKSQVLRTVGVEVLRTVAICDTVHGFDRRTQSGVITGVGGTKFVKLCNVETVQDRCSVRAILERRLREIDGEADVLRSFTTCTVGDGFKEA